LRSQFPAGFTPQELTVFSIEAAPTPERGMAKINKPAKHLDTIHR
jgi:hypothetical protein